MIQKLSIKDTLDVLDFVNKTKDVYFDFYITKNNKRIFLRKDSTLIQKLLKSQQVFAIKNKEIESLMLLYIKKPFRPYIKFLVKNNCDYKIYIDFLKSNFSNMELYLKVKQNNPIVNELLNTTMIGSQKRYIPKEGFSIGGFRGKEILIILNKK